MIKNKRGEGKRYLKERKRVKKEERQTTTIYSYKSHQSTEHILDDIATSYLNLTIVCNCLHYM